MERKINWGIIGTGNIAKTFARAVLSSSTGWLVAVGSRQQDSADAFAGEFKIAKAYGSYDALLSDADVHAVYIATPHTQHAPWAIKAAKAKKHLLVEKPLSVTAAETKSIIDAAEASGVFLMEAFMYRSHPQTQKLVELIREKKCGDVRLIQATFSFQTTFDPKSRLFDPNLGGGGILDVGCYPMSMARLIAGAANGKDFADPIEVKGAGHLGQTGVDEWATASLKFPGNVVAQISTGVSLRQDNFVKIFCSEGWIALSNPWVFDGANAETGKIVMQRSGDPQPREIVVEADETSFTYEVETVGKAIISRKNESPAMSWQDSLGNAKALDQWRQSIGLAYEFDKRR
jgi:predicted dehydrogenase